MHREPEVPEAEALVGKWLDCRARITSKELAPLHSVKNGILQNACHTSPNDADLAKSALIHTARLMDTLAKGISKWWQEWSGHVVNYTTIGLCIPRYGAAEVFNDFAEELKHTEANPMCSIH